MREPLPYGRYLLIDRLDVGGMAEVFLARVAHGEDAGRLVAVKRLLPTLAEDPELVRMFLDEARIAVQLDHPAVARVEDLGRHGASYFIAMEYVAGRSLRVLLEAVRARGEKLPVPLAAYVALRLLEALDHVHARRDCEGRPLGIVHRDVAPHNVLLGFDGEVKLLDFGLARAGARGAPAEPGVLRGRAAYLSPEQARGLEVDGRADLFAAGIVLHEMLTGDRLFAAPSDLLALERVVEGEVRSPRERNPAVPEALAAAVLSALERDPARRPPTAGALAAAVAPHLGGCDAAALARYLAERLPEELARAQALGRAS